MSLFDAKILEIWIVYIFDVYHQHGQDKITSTKHFLAGQLDNRDIEGFISPILQGHIMQFWL